MSEKQWLESNRYYPTIEEEKLKSIFYFSLVWNIFEKECCHKNASIGNHPKNFADKLSNNIDSNLLNEIFQYFKNRYIENGDANDIFNRFDFGREPASSTYKNFVKDRLLKEETTNQEKLQSLLYIAFRLRNNLFHGIKDVEKLYEQNENFKQINSLLMAIIEQKSYCR